MSLLAGYRFHVVARYGLSYQIPPLKIAELGYDTDTKAGRIGDDTSTPPRIMTDKSNGNWDFSSVAEILFPTLSLVEGDTVDGVDVSTLRQSPHTFTYHDVDGVFKNVEFVSTTNSVQIGTPQATEDPNKHVVSVDLSPDLLQLVNSGFNLSHIINLDNIPSTLNPTLPLFRHQNTIYYWNIDLQKYEPIAIPLITETDRVPTEPLPYVYLDAIDPDNIKMMVWSGSGYAYVGGSPVTTSPNEPDGPSEGSYWYNNEEHILYMYVDNQWITIAFETPISPSYLARRGLLLQWQHYDDKGYAWEFFVNDRNFNMLDAVSVPVQTFNNDDTITVPNSFLFKVGGNYTIYTDNGSIFNVEIFSRPSPTSLRLTTTLNQSLGEAENAKIGSSSFILNGDGTATASGSRHYYSRPLNTLHSWPRGYFRIRRSNEGIGEYTVKYREDGTDTWITAKRILSQGVEGHPSTDETYLIDVGNTNVQLHVAYSGNINNPEILHQFALHTSPQNIESDRVYQPENISPVHQAVNIGPTPTLEGSAYRSLYGIPQGGAQFQIARDQNFNELILNTSTDTLVSWIATAGETANFTDAVFIGEREAVIVGLSNTIETTADGGKTFTTRTPDTTGDYRSVAFNRDTVILLAGDNGIIQRSVNKGITWTDAAGVDGFSGDLNGIAAYGNYGVAVGTSGKILISTNAGVIWFSSTAAASFSGVFHDVAMTSNGRVVAVGAAGTIQTSADYGVTWVSRTPAGAYSDIFFSVSITDDGYVVIAGENGEIQTSSDFGATWVQRTAADGYSGDFKGSAYLGEKIVLVGTSGEVQTSFNRGQTWVSRPTGGATTETLNAVVINDEPYAFIVGLNGEIQRTIVLEGAGISFTMPEGEDLLTVNDVFWWRCRYQDAVGFWSIWSVPTAFATADDFDSPGAPGDFGYVGQPSNISPSNNTTGISTTPTLASSAFTYGGTADTHTHSQWQISTNAGFTDIVYNSGEIADLLSHKVPVENALDIYEDYFWRVRHKGSVHGLGAWSIPTTFTTQTQPMAPTITSPTNGASGLELRPTIQTSSFVNADPSVPHVASQYQVSTVNNFSTVLYDSGSISQLTSHRIPIANALSSSTTYYVRARHQGQGTGWSNWSTVISFATLAVAVTKPTLIISNISQNGVNLTSSSFALTGNASDTHQSTDWELRTAANGGGSLVWSSLNSTTNKTTISATGLPSGSTLHARVRHKGTSYGLSEWSNSMQFSTSAATGEQTYTSAGTYNFVVPAGVTSICAVIISGGASGNPMAHPYYHYIIGGGGGGGALAWKNNIAVTPGQVIPITVGNGGAGTTVQIGQIEGIGNPGSSSALSNIMSCSGGQPCGINSASDFGAGGQRTGGDGGGNGGRGGCMLNPNSGGAPGMACGGGAGGYMGNGGDGGLRVGFLGLITTPPTAGSGGGGGGGSRGGGGGVGIYGLGSNGSNNGGGGSGGTSGSEMQNNGRSGGAGGIFGGGGSGSSYAGDGQVSYPSGAGGRGACRIIWGAGRSFPHFAA